jgi:hypothetical protein
MIITQWKARPADPHRDVRAHLSQYGLCPPSRLSPRAVGANLPLNENEHVKLTKEAAMARFGIHPSRPPDPGNEK